MTVRITIEDTESGNVLTGEATTGYLLLTVGEHEIGAQTRYGNETRQFTIKRHEGEAHEAMVQTNIELEHRPGGSA